MMGSIHPGAYKRPSKACYYLGIAKAVAARSTCLKRHYGCVIVKDDVIVATGYNGSPRGSENCCDRGTCKRIDAKRYSGYELCDSVHAEQNALLSASREEAKGATVYLCCEEWNGSAWETDSNPMPCPLCMRMLINAGIARVVNMEGKIWQG